MIHGSLLLAAYNSDIPRFRLLLSQGADVNEVELGTGFTSLHIACLRGDTALAQEIIEHDNRTDEVDFQIRCLHRPRLAWQLAMNAHYYALARIVDDAGLRKHGAPHLA